MREGKINSNGIQLHYEDWGKTTDPAILLVCGMAAQLIHWPDSMLKHFVNSGFRVIRFDNREAGLSDCSHVKKSPPVIRSFLKTKLGFKIQADYNLLTLVKDAVGLLDALEIPRAHWVGCSMGGMIAQLAAIHYQEKVHTLTSIMSSPQDEDLPSPKLWTLLNMFMPVLGKTDKHLVDSIVRISWNIRSTDFPTAKDELRQQAYQTIQRSQRPMAKPMHSMAIMATEGFGKDLHKVTAPSLIIHGTVDPLVKLAGGKRSAKCIPNSKLTVIPGMGHDFPVQLLDHLSIEITTHISSAK